MIEKTVLDMVTALAVVVNAELGNWDKAAAYFYGASGKSAYTIYGRAEKRCANYGTCTGSGGEAAVNTAIGAALTANAAADVIKYIKVLYCQNVLRYANLIDQNIGTEAIVDLLAEGQAFWRILAPWMTAHSNDAAKIFDRMFSTELNPQAANNYNYCIAKKHIDSFLTSVMGSANDAATALGSLNEFPSGVQPCPTDGNGLITTSDGIVTTISTDAGTYTLKAATGDNDIGGALQLPEAVKKVVDVLVAGTDTDIQVFASGMYEYTSLKGIADAAAGECGFIVDFSYGGLGVSGTETGVTSTMTCEECVKQQPLSYGQVWYCRKQYGLCCGLEPSWYTGWSNREGWLAFESGPSWITWGQTADDFEPGGQHPWCPAGSMSDPGTACSATGKTACACPTTRTVAKSACGDPQAIDDSSCGRACGKTYDASSGSWDVGGTEFATIFGAAETSEVTHFTYEECEGTLQVPVTFTTCSGTRDIPVEFAACNGTRDVPVVYDSCEGTVIYDDVQYTVCDGFVTVCPETPMSVRFSQAMAYSAAWMSALAFVYNYLGQRELAKRVENLVQKNDLDESDDEDAPAEGAEGAKTADVTATVKLRGGRANMV